MLAGPIILTPFGAGYPDLLQKFAIFGVFALGFNISVDKPPARIRTVRLSNEPYLQHNGYKPAPLDLGAVDLNAKMEELVDKLAENTHNVWARERISQVNKIA